WALRFLVSSWIMCTGSVSAVGGGCSFWREHPHCLRRTHLLAFARRPSGSQVSRLRRERVDSGGVATRRTAKIYAAQLLSAPSPGERPCLGSRLDLFWDNRRHLCAEFLGTATGEIPLQPLFQ